ncbi:MAG: hypothetical protein IPI81_01530 [Flavobacteriales bacterium]|nr:hypothetical protein [Flavobacteriales bacterium]MCC6939957.1 hypothetical protein [Flavobacteriales bacterium]
MRTEADRWLGALFHGWVELLTLFLMLLVALAIIGWCWNRGFRPADRGPVVPVMLLLVGYGLILLLRAFKHDHWAAITIGVAVLLSGFIGRGSHPRGLWTPAIIIAALLGLGLNLSAAALVLVVALALLLSARSGR